MKTKVQPHKLLLAVCCIIFAVTSVSAQVPTYITSGGTSSNNYPFNNASNNKVQWVYAPGDFTPKIPGGMITHVYFLTDNFQSTNNVPFSDYRISIKHVKYNTFSSGTFESSMNVVYGPKSTNISVPSNGWFGVKLDAPFVYDGTSSLVIEATITNQNKLRVDQNTSGGNKRIWGGRNSTSGSTGSGAAGCGLEIVTCSTAVTKQPVGATVCENQNTAFEIDAIDVDKYQWQADEGTGFFDLSDGPIYSGTGTAKLSISNTPFSFDGVQYRCIATNKACADTSSAVTLNVNGLVKLEAMPAKDTTCINATMDLEVKGTGSITNYTWQIYNNITSKFEDVPSVPPYTHLGNKLQITGVPDTLDGARYRVLVDGVCDNDLSTTIQIKVNAIPKVAVPPADVNTSHGKQVMFEVQATAAGARFQWQVAQSNAANYVNVNDGGIYSGSRTNRLRVNSVTRVQNEYRFRCIVRTGDACVAPGDTSQFAVLYVEPIVGVENVSSEEYMVVYPNPTSGSELYIELKGMATEGLSYQVIDKVGRLVSAGKFNSTGKTTIDVSNLSADMYMIKMIDTDGKQVATSKFTKM